MADAPVAPVAPTEPEVTGTCNEQQPPPAVGTTPPPLLPEPMTAVEKLENMELKVLQAELESLKTAMTGAMIDGESALPTHEMSESAVNDLEEDVAKAQLRVLLGMQAMMVESYQAQRKSLQVTMLSARVTETCTKLMSHHFVCMENQLKCLSKYIAKDVDLGQSTLDSMEFTLDKFGTSFNTLGDTLKDMFASQRTSGSKEEDLRKTVISELAGLKEVLGHVRSNTNSQMKEMRNVAWETRELRALTTDTSGDTSASGGSLLLTIDKNLQAAANGCIEAMAKMTSELMGATERGEKPELSHKRKAEQDSSEQERKRAMLEKQQQELREKVYHPIRGQVMYLTDGERQELLFQSLNLMKKGDEAMGPPPVAHAAPTVPHAAPQSSYPSMMPHGKPPAGMPPTGIPPMGIPTTFPPASPYGQPYYGAPPAAHGAPSA